MRLLSVILLVSAAASQATAQEVSFNRDVRPILSDSCFACHGPDETNRKADLRLDVRDGTFVRDVIVPGNAAGSRLYQRVSHEVEMARMPPQSFGRPLKPEQVDTLRRWIDQGAKWETHWAFEPPTRAQPPSVGEESWVRNPIDRFVLARLGAEGLKPSPEADRATLLRRLSLDLTGLPPTPVELDAYLPDKSDSAYERAVERLLDSPRYGERMAMRWLDLARYSDTHGYHIDSHRDMWRWRDWVIEAYNRNMPFDEFTVEQLAGDLLPEATQEQIIATGFNRNHMINFEGGAIPEEYQTEYVVDRVETVSEVWMGLTMGCARCHEHKYDPISQRDFYRFFAYFNTIGEKGLDGQQGNAGPLLELPTAEQTARRKELEAGMEAVKRDLPEDEIARLQADWRAGALDAVPAPPESSLETHFAFEGDLGSGSFTLGEAGYGAGRVGKALKFDGEQTASLGRVASLAGDRPFALALWTRVGGIKGVTVLQQIEQDGSRRGFELFFDESQKVPDEYKTAGPMRVRLTGAYPENGIEIRSSEPVTTRDWHHVVVNYDGSGRADGFRLYVDGKPMSAEIVRDSLSGSTAANHDLQIGAKAFARQPFEGEIDELRVYSRMLAETEVEALNLHDPIRAILSAEKPGKPQEEELRDYYLRQAAPVELRQAYAKLKGLEAELAAVNKRVVTTMVMAEMPEPRETFVLARGDYRNQTEKVSPATPAVLPPLPRDAPANRLGMARWLVSGDHPLTARVEVNRYWEMYFGTGLVKSAENFGSQGEPPSHPELLDWLATQFVDSGWNIKAMQRLIVTSAAYRQSSKVSCELTEIDPENRLLARGPRFRLPAETVRDNALAVSGLLNPRIGGPSAAPYQPAGLWEDVSYGDRFTAQSYEQDHGEALYRRAMYTFWKRTAPPPSLLAFDAPDREKCTIRRARTNTPLQALVLLNDPTYVEASRAFAERMIREGGDEPGERIDFAYRRALCRTPNANERDVLLSLLHSEREEFDADPRAAQDLLSVGESPRDERIDPAELAAWTTVASTILNLDETISKE